MAQRPIWRGHLRLALVSCPVALYSAKHDRGTIRFNMINPETDNRIKMLTVAPSAHHRRRSKTEFSRFVGRGWVGRCPTNSTTRNWRRCYIRHRRLWRRNNGQFRTGRSCIANCGDRT